MAFNNDDDGNLHVKQFRTKHPFRKTIALNYPLVPSVVDDVTSGGIEFLVRDAAAGKARSPVVRIVPDENLFESPLMFLLLKIAF